MVPTLRKRKPHQAQSQVAPVETQEVTKGSKRQKKLPVRARDDNTASAEQAPQASAPSKGTLKVFDDDDDNADVAVKTSVSTAEQPPAVSTEPNGSEEEDDSDDEAPEAVSTQKAASDVKKSAQAAQQAAKEQALTQKRKRQERDAMLKQQAEERKKTAMEESESEPEVEEDGDEAIPDALENQEEVASDEAVQNLEGSTSRRRTDRSLMPTLLPEEFLTDSSSEDEEDEAPGTKSRPKRRKVATAEKNLARHDKAQAPKDVVAGSTVFRVAKKMDERMAPKARKHAKSSRELLLKRNRTAAKPRSGFFTSK